MPQMPKILGIIFACLVVAQTALFLGVNFSGEKALAEPNGPKWTMPDPQIKLFKDFKFTKPICVTDQEGRETCSIPWIGEYIVGIYKYAIGVVGILAAVVMMFGGVRWIMAGGNASAISEAKAWIAAALTGLVLALASYTILYYINPSLTQPTPIKVAMINKDKSKCGECPPYYKCENINPTHNSNVQVTIKGVNNYACLSIMPGQCTFTLSATNITTGQQKLYPTSKHTNTEKQCIDELYNLLSDIINTLKNYHFNVLEYNYITDSSSNMPLSPAETIGGGSDDQEEFVQ